MARRKSNKQAKAIIESINEGCLWINDWNEGSSTLLRCFHDYGRIIKVSKPSKSVFVSIKANQEEV